MIVTSVNGKQISIVESKHGILIDTAGNWWTRDASKDTSDAAGYSNQDKEDYMQLTRPELKRVCKGNTAIQQLTTVAEMRDFANRLKPDLQAIADDLNDQQLREILIEADTDNKSCLSLLLCSLVAEQDRREAKARVEAEERISCEREGTSLELERPAGTSVPLKKKAQRKPKEYAFEREYDGTDVRLTQKQVIMMLAVSRSLNEMSPCSTASVLHSVANEMSAVSAGAVLSTLKEKDIINVDKSAGLVSPTKVGAQVIVALLEKEGEPNEKDK